MSVAPDLRNEFAHWMGLWQEQRSAQATPARWKADLTRVQKYVLPHWGRRVVTRITPDQVEEWVSDLVEAGVGKSTVYASLMALRQALDLAEEASVLRSNPARGVTVEGVRSVREPQEEDIPAWDEVVRIFDNADEYFRALILLAAESGARWEEALAVRDVDLHLEEGLVSLGQKRIVEAQGRAEEVDGAHRDVRLVPIDEMLIEALRHHLEITREWRTKDRPWLFLTKRDHVHPLRSNFNIHVWRPALRAAGIPERRYTFQSLRYTAALRMIEQETPVERLSKYLGHRSVTTTRRLYKKWLREADAEHRRRERSNDPPSVVHLEDRKRGKRAK